MGHNLSKALGKNKGTTLAENEFSWREKELNLIGVRDFISLWLTYPVKLVEEEKGILKAWIIAFSEWKTSAITQTWTDDDQVTEHQFRVLTEKAMISVEGLLPLEIIGKIQSCGTGRSIFNHNDVIPEAILNLTVDLAVEQLIQTLFSGGDYAHNLRYVRLLTRNLVEKRSVVNKIVAAMEDKRSSFGIDKDFLDVLLIDASTNQSYFQVQEEINKMMAGPVIEDNDMLRTRRAEEEMANKYLVILVDRDSGEKLDPWKVNFPAGIVVLITTEPSAPVEEGDEYTITCSTIDLNIRTQDHLLPWEVFCSCVGSSMVRSSRAIQRIAVKIVEECRGHLLAIVLVANSLKNVNDVKRWELALHKLRYTNPSYDYQESGQIGISRVMVNAFVNIIWEDIKKTLKLCLELCLFIHKIKNGVPGKALMSNWVCIELVHTKETAQHLFTFDSSDIESEYTREEAEHDIRELLDRSVLLQCESRNVRLPVETYDIIESLHTLNPSILRHGALRLTEPLHIGRWHGLIRIELMDSKIFELPQSPDCPKLSVLLLQGNVDLMDIPDSFFDQMPQLRYLDLSYTSIRDLPPSITKLIQLQKFYLRGCDLFMDLPPKIGQLRNLEQLDLDGTLITHLPKEIRELINLQSLTLCFDDHKHGHGNNDKQISSSTIIPPGVISNLTRLNYLSISVDPEDEQWNESVLNILLEIFGLERLETVNIYIPNVEFLGLIPFHKPIDFRLVVGHHMRRFIARTTAKVEEKFKHCGRSLRFVNGVNVPNGVKTNLGHCRALYLDRHMTIKSLSEFELKNLDRLQVCILGECNEMETVVDVNYSCGGYALPNLEFLSVFYMKNLKSICSGTPRMNPVFLHSLKTIALHTCPMLTTVFTSSFIDNLSLLEELIVEDCSKLTTVMSHDSLEHETQYFLPRLKTISLLYLPELVSIFSGLPVGQGLEKMGFYYCPKLQSLSKAELSSKSLWVIKGEKRWWEALKWNESEWEDANMLEYLDLIFSPIDEEADILTQLVAHNDEDLLVRCPMCEGLLSDLSNSSVYQCGGCSAVFQAESKSTNDASGDQPTVPVVSSTTTSNAESNSSTSKLEELKVASRLLKFTFNDLKLATRNFRPDTVLGEGEFGCVFKGWIKEIGTAPVKPGTGLCVTVKTLNSDGRQGRYEWLAEVKFLGNLNHPNLVKLIGYCIEDDQRLLVYEFMPQGSLENQLFRTSVGALPLPWSTRMKIALGAAKGLAFLHDLAFLHEEAELAVIYGDFKTSNILLDADYNAKLSDFGLFKGPRPVTDHAAPEYVATGHLTAKSDVYSFGVVLLELLTGRKSFDKFRPAREQNLAEWALPLLKEKRKLLRIIDPRLDGGYPVEAVRKAAILAYRCLNHDPKARPRMRDIIDSLEPLQAHNVTKRSHKKH